MEITPKQLTLPSVPIGRLWAVQAVPSAVAHYAAGAWQGVELARRKALSASAKEIALGALLAVIAGGVVTYGLPLVPFLAALFLFGMGLGYLTLGLQALLGEGRLAMVPALAAMIPVFGILIPVERLPNALQLLAHFLPLTYAAEGLRTALEGGFLLSAFIAAFLLSGVYTYFAHLFYTAMFAEADMVQ